MTNTAARDPLATALKNGQLLVKLASLFTFVTGLLLTWQPLLRHSELSQQLERIVLPRTIAAADFTNLLTGLALTYLAYELLQRKRSAWFIALGASVANIVSQAYIGRPTIHTLFLLFVIVTLLAGRNQFVVKAPAVHLVQGARALVASIVLALAYGTAGFWLLDQRDFGRTFSLTESFENTLQQYWPFSSNDLVAHTRYSHWFLNSLTVVGVTTILYCLYSILRPLKHDLSEAPAERARARALLEKYGGGIDDYFKLWPHDKSYFFSADGEAFIAYGVARGVAVCFANPEGKPESIDQLMQDFKAFCFNNGWLIAFIAANDKHKTLFAHLGFGDLLIGADAVIDIDKFLGETVRNKYFRNIVNRFEKGNFACTRYLPPHPPARIAELRAVSNDWLKIPGHKEWRFITGYFSSRYFRETPLFVLRDARGKTLAFANELPSFKAGEATIDLMRHRRDVPKNTMDYLFIDLMRNLHERQIARFNLGLSPLARQSFSGNSGRLLDYIYLATQRFVSTKGLHQYKVKFEPEWQPRYVYYVGNTSSLPKIGLALSRLSLQRRPKLR
ncbi:MAG TPA: phosphatidylglycerol lysyltransferase domain-containing protein [Candidatus Saccharimonadales bacterium]|jgi:phosphatidylglycerol lysyltransferase